MLNEIPERFREGDWIARQFLTDAELDKSPEEYAATHADRWECFSLHLYKYRDPVLGAWVRRLGEILASEAEIDRCRRQYLTGPEIDDIRREANDPFGERESASAAD